ncbi:MAG: hypothetical protein LBJ11_06515 [Oscillospiraceae bacterium]|jgi:hypothetical protein|nr:hypothetical protein [Oscillospiraceae bacterium]
MSQWGVLGQLRLLTVLDEEGAREALPFCAAALAQVRATLRADAGEDPRIDRAAAGLAFYMMTLREENGEGILSFRAGDIAVSRKDAAARLRAAEEVRDEGMTLIASLQRDEGFCAGQTVFRGYFEEDRPARGG